MREHWGLDERVIFLNHGSFGACPTAVLREQARLREQMEAEPVRFMTREVPALLAAAREALGLFLGAPAAELAFVPNATTGVNAVIRSLPLHAGDEIVVTDHEYNACRNVVDFVAERRGARVVVATIPLPVAGPAAVVERVLGCLSPKTRLILIDHVTSQTGLVLPVETIAREALARGIDVLIDGAHAPGMLPLDLNSLGPVFYTGNLHKWVCAPKGAAFLRVPLDRQAEIRPPVISHGANAPTHAKSRFRFEFDWCGTDDPTARLTVPRAIEFMGGLHPGGWQELMRRNRELALEGRAIVSAALDMPLPAPAEMIGSLGASFLPDRRDAASFSAFDTDPLQDRLLTEFGIEVPIMFWPTAPKRLIRVSAQAYNRVEDYRALAEALRLAL